MQEFLLDRSSARLFRACVWLYGGLALLSVACGLWGDDYVANPTALHVIAAFAALHFGAFAWHGYRVAQTLPFTGIAAGNEGLWPAHLSKAIGLVRWERIDRIGERSYWQRLDLLDASGATLLKVEYQLAGFEMLRALIMEKTGKVQRVAVGRPVFAKSAAYHAAHLGSTLDIILLGLYIGAADPWLTYGAVALVVALGLRDYLTAAWRLAIAAEYLEIGYALRSRQLRREQIAAIELADVLVESMRQPEVYVLLDGAQKPIRLQGLGIGASDLHQLLKAWMTRHKGTRRAAAQHRGAAGSQ